MDILITAAKIYKKVLAYKINEYGFINNYVNNCIYSFGIG